MNTHSEVCLLDFGGGCEIPPSKLKDCWRVAQTSTKQLCQFLEQTLQDADEQAQKQRLEKLKQQQDRRLASSATSLPPNTPYFEESKFGDEMNVEVDIDVDHIAEAEKKAEEAYRQQALDYSRGHVASRVREDNTQEKSYPNQKGKSLLAAMLKSANQVDKGESGENVEDSPLKSVQQTSSLALPVVKASEHLKVTNHADPHNVVSKAVAQVAMHLDDDEDEEAPAILKSEFDTLPSLPTTEEDFPKKTAPTPTANSIDEANDLLMAIKKKSKKRKSKKPK